ncbi:uncharacterized protein LOC131002044 isoform X2 [Salvia miltiorrhiza]|uniref:uncharacterized protein LOC131002044 isoform X2 n=1 Tax=Salvia miltiorrhiza TaxID=226208 RepID=UPI0025ACC341|nr:uncharacterized protein LOC131002044 isoform X2 [Salvia miltiorrhiza]
MILDIQLMVKPKQRQLHGAPDEGDWMVVKKQRITIIIPPLPNKKHSAMPCIGDAQLQEKPTGITNSHLQCSRSSTVEPQAPSLSHRREGNDINPCSSIPRARQGMKIFGDSTSFLNQRMRASYLEKKIRKAGGLENWLISLGLARFIKVFQMRRVGKFQLANLTMQKLKDMGTDAVGPRRKLMHAIDCLCQPHCFHHI